MLTTNLRMANPADDAFLEHLFAETHRPELAPLALPETQLVALLQMQARAQRTSYNTSYPHAESLIIQAPQAPHAAIGRLLLDRTPQRTLIVDIALLPAWRGVGLGTQVLSALLQDSRLTRVPVCLSVRSGNPARNLYQRLGFRELAKGLDVAMEYMPHSSEQ